MKLVRPDEKRTLNFMNRLNLEPHMDILKESFPDLVEVIHQCRIADAELDEICRDFELLKTDLRKAMRLNGGLDSPYQNDLRESIAGLREEILLRVRK